MHAAGDESRYRYCCCRCGCFRHWSSPEPGEAVGMSGKRNGKQQQRSRARLVRTSVGKCKLDGGT